MNREELAQAIPPAYTEFIGKLLIEGGNMVRICKHCSMNLTTLRGPHGCDRLNKSREDIENIKPVSTANVLARLDALEQRLHEVEVECAGLKVRLRLQDTQTNGG